MVFQKLLDTALFLYFLFMAVVIPLFDAQSCIPRSYYPDVLADLSASYARDYGDFLVAEPPRFFVGLVWFELAIHWPLCLANLAGILGSKPWFPTTCLVYGVSVATSMAAILSELMGSPKASDRLKMVYFPFLGVAVLSVLRGLLPNRGKTSAASSAGTSLTRKKRASNAKVKILPFILRSMFQWFSEIFPSISARILNLTSYCF